MRVRFCGFEIDDDRRELLRDGTALPVEPRVFDLICYLLRHRDRVVAKDELLERLWPDSDVQEGALSVCVHRARRILGTDGDRIIRTVSRCGFRFVAEVEQASRRAGAGSDSFFGRDREMEALLRLVDGLREAPELRSFEISGGAGIGKTAMLLEVGTHGRRRKLEVLRASPREGDGSGFSLWVQIVSAFMARYDARSVQRAMGEHVDPLARLVPALRSWASPRWEETSGAPSGRIYDSMARALRNAATPERPVMLLFDDFDGTDPESIATLRHMIGACPDVPWIVGISYRRAEPTLEDLLATMRSRRDHLRIELAPIGEDAARQLLQKLAGAPVAGAVVAEALAASGGLPAALEQWWRQQRAAADRAAVEAHDSSVA